ncbi:MAG: tetratricopeptide repeat protein, partial [Gallionella sp.]
KGIKFHKAGEFGKAIDIYNRVLNREPTNNSLRFLLSDAFLRTEWNGLAANMLQHIVREEPENAEAICNLGVAYRKENFYDPAKQCWERCLALKGDSVEVCSNMAGLYADSGKPEEALHWLDRALKIEPDNPEANWQKALALLTTGDYREGWKSYEWRFKIPNWDCRSSIKVPMWDGLNTRHLYIHGEQGVGDEIMFLSCVDEAIKSCQHVTLEVNRKVAGIARLTWPHIDVVTDETPGDYSAKIALGSLAGMYRRTIGDFPGREYLKPDPRRVEYYKSRLEEFGKPPYVALAWVGGIKQTRVVDRSMGLVTLKPVMDRYSCVSAQYNDRNPAIDADMANNGLRKIDEASAGGDLAEQAALFKAVDAVVTVQQTAVHVAGAVGTPTFAMIAHNPQWRYGIRGSTIPWYRSVQLFRKAEGDDWSGVVGSVMKALGRELD